MEGERHLARCRSSQETVSVRLCISISAVGEAAAA